jgi:hypothetical protein
MPVQTQIVGPDQEVVLVVDGLLLLPLGAIVRVSETFDAAVVAVRFTADEVGVPLLILEVDAGPPTLELAAIREAEAEAEVVSAAEEITAGERCAHLD